MGYATVPVHVLYDRICGIGAAGGAIEARDCQLGESARDPCERPQVRYPTLSPATQTASMGHIACPVETGFAACACEHKILALGSVAIRRHFLPG